MKDVEDVIKLIDDDNKVLISWVETYAMVFVCLRKWDANEEAFFWGGRGGVAGRFKYTQISCVSSSSERI